MPTKHRMFLKMGISQSCHLCLTSSTHFPHFFPLLCSCSWAFLKIVFSCQEKMVGVWGKKEYLVKFQSLKLSLITLLYYYSNKNEKDACFVNPDIYSCMKNSLLWISTRSQKCEVGLCLWGVELWLKSFEILCTLFCTFAEDYTMAICTTIWRLGPERWGFAWLLNGFFKNQRNEKTKQKGSIKGKSWKWRRAYFLCYK